MLLLTQTLGDNVDGDKYSSEDFATISGGEM